VYLYYHIKLTVCYLHVGRPVKFRSMVNSALHSSGVTEWSTDLIGWGRGRNVASTGWLVTLYNPIWHASSRSSEASCKLIYTRLHYLSFTIVQEYPNVSERNSYLRLVKIPVRLCYRVGSKNNPGMLFSVQCVICTFFFLL